MKTTRCIPYILKQIWRNRVRSLLTILGIGIDWQQVIKGLVLLAAVIFDVYNKSRQG